MAADREDTATAAVFRALADPTRRQILQDLCKGELAAGDIASRFPISGPSISRHLAVLKAAGLITERRQANRVIYSLVPGRLVLSVGSFLSAVCPEETLARHQGKKKPKAPEKASAKPADKASGKSADKASGKSADKASGKSADKDKRRRALVDPAPALDSVGTETTGHFSATV